MPGAFDPDEAEADQPIERLGDDAVLRARLTGGLSPVGDVLLRQHLHPAAQRRHVRRACGGQVLRKQQRGVAVGALLRHAHIGELVVGVDQRDPLGAQLRQQPGGLGDPSGDGDSLAAEEVVSLGLGQLVVIDDRVAQQPPRHGVP